LMRCRAAAGAKSSNISTTSRPAGSEETRN
jgi:hypothetical protein